MLYPSGNQPIKIVAIDDHHLILEGTQSAILLGKGCVNAIDLAKATIQTANCATEGFILIQEVQPNLVLLDLAIPHFVGGPAHTEHGLHLLKYLMEQYPELNLTIQSSNVKALVRLIPEIETHQGGFTIVDKACPVETLLKRIEWALQGVHYTQDIQVDIEVRPEWMEVLQLAFEKGLQDKAIAEEMHKSERMIRQYWSKIRDVLGVYPEADKNIRSLTYIQAKEFGLID